MQPVYKRILLKLSGEALAGEQGFGLNQEVIAGVVDEIVKVHAMGVEIGVVIGGGNFWRGRQGTKMDRSTADQMGMLATVMNSLAMMDAIEQDRKPYVDAVAGRNALEMILAIYQSAATGKPVKLPLEHTASTDFTGRFDK